MFINQEYIEKLLSDATMASQTIQDMVITRAENGERLSDKDIAVLLHITDNEKLSRIFRLAGEIKNRIYGNRVVLFAPLYISNYCVNNCVYCGYRQCNTINRKRLNREQIQEEVKILEKMGHKRLALEAGEDPVNCTIDYILEALDAIYETKLDNGSIRRVNVNIAATTVENYTRLKEKGIGTYILFQETYHAPTYKKMHPNGPKSNYEYHLTAFDRAMQGGVDDVGAGVLFGLYDYKFEVLSLMLHNKYLEDTYGTGFHTISVPRLKKAAGMELSDFTHIPADEDFKKLVAILRIAVPYTGIIMSTRETAEMRKEAISFGVSQISAGSCTEIGGYKEEAEGKSIKQFEISDHRKPIDVVKELLDMGYIPSYCTACYRKGRTGDRFMSLAKSGNIQYVCTPNALMTLTEFMLDYGDSELIKKGDEVIQKELENIKRDDIKQLLHHNIKRIKNGERDLYL